MTHRPWRNSIAALPALAVLLGSPAAWGAEKQKAFAAPEEAVQELVAAARANDLKAMLTVLGPGAKDIVSTGDAAEDRATYERFSKSYDESNRIDLQGGATATLVVGKDAWPFPVPLVKSDAGWRFDAKRGRDEVISRRIGRNELSVIQAVQAYVDAQREYYLRNPAQDKVLAYAQKVVSDKGRRDGLYFPTRDGEPPSPLGELFAKAQAAGYNPGGKPIPYFGYYYRILKAQGADAKGGAFDYVARGKMIGGFALVAYPAAYGSSGIATFIVNHDGVVYQKDLGPQTASVATKMTRFNPDGTWKRI
jgi:hypothetical protein